MLATKQRAVFTAAAPTPAPLRYQAQIETAFAEVHRPANLPTAPRSYTTAAAAIAALQPSEPVFCINPRELRAAAARFAAFPGRALYAVKCNPDPFVLRTLFDAGITDFDVASIGEVRLIEELFGKRAGQFFNNPAKTRPAIREASRDFGIRFYTADCVEEVDKIVDEALPGTDLVIAVRLSTIARDARYVLSTKFGAGPDEAVRMLRHIHRADIQAGISFHVGSQCLAPQAFSTALSLVAKVTAKAGVPIAVLNVGGGFPAPYPGDEVRGLDYYLSRIVHGRRELQAASGCLLLCEPGRSLVATAGTVILQVVTRRDRVLFLNDGIFGTLQELGHPKERRPVTLHRRRGTESSTRMAEFRIYGPTCDSNDVLGAPFVLPDDVREGDWIEVGMMGAYSLSMRTRFNGFHTDQIVAIEA